LLRLPAVLSSFVLSQGLSRRVPPAANDEIGDLPPVGAKIGQPLIVMRMAEAKFRKDAKARAFSGG
jgi:hypothetical protein